MVLPWSSELKAGPAEAPTAISISLINPADKQVEVVKCFEMRFIDKDREVFRAFSLYERFCSD